MEIQTEKLTFEEKLLKRNANQKGDFWEELSQEQKDKIQQGIEEFDRGEFVSYETIVSKFR